MAKYIPPFVSLDELHNRTSSILDVYRVVEDMPDDKINLDSYGSMKDGICCVASLIVTTPILNQGYFKNRATVYPEDAAVCDIPYALPNDWDSSKNWSEAPHSWQLMNHYFDDPEGHTKYCTMYGRGKYDTIVNGRGTNPMSHKELVLHRFRMGLSDIEKLLKLFHSESTVAP